MFLKALTLKGFKSFADSTTMVLEPGVTVVVGPNGSGKSNVVDAIAWVLGAQAPSAVRSQKMDDVIFAGTAKRPALGRAEVALTIDNSSGLLPIEFTEVTLSRTLFRTGESEYAINGVACRLLDLQDLLSDSGVGRQQHVIVSQGQIDSVLNARPEDRRSIIEEAAGVLKFRKRKEKAERRLEATEGNLLRVQDLLREVRRQLRPLERQAEAAKRHGDLVTELGALKLFLAGREIAGQRSRLQTLEGEKRTFIANESALRSELARLDTAVMATEMQLSALGGFDLGDSLVRVEQLRERAKGLSAVLTERRRGLDRDRNRLMDTGVVANLEADAARMRGELDDVESAASALAPDAAEVEEAETSLAADRLALTDGGGEQPGSRTAAGAAAEVRGELRTLRQATDRASSEAQRLSARLRSLGERMTRLEGETERHRSACQEAESAEQPLVDALESAEARRSSADAALDAAEQASRTVQAEQSTWQARADALGQALDQARARAGAERLASVQGVVGTLLDLVDVDEGWEAAFEAAAGEALSAVVVDGLEAARRALRTLHDSKTAGAVLALGSSLPPSVPPPVGEVVRGHVRSSNPAVAHLLDSLLGSAVVVSGGWTEAVDCVLAHPDAVVVTRDGDRFGIHGWRLGVASSGATGAALAEAQSRAEAAAADLLSCRAVVATARAEQQAAKQAEADLGRRLDQHDGCFSASADGLARAQAERREASTEIEALSASQSEIEERLARERGRIAELETVLPTLEADETAEAELVRSAQLARTRMEQRVASVASMRRELEVRAAGLEERRTFLEHRLGEIGARLAANSVEVAQAAERRGHVERQLVAIDRLSALVETRRHTIDGELVELQERRRKQSEAARAVAAELDGHRRQRQGAEKSLENLRERGRRTEIEEAEVKLRLETAVEAVRRELDVEPEVALAAGLPAVPEGSTAAGRARDLDRELRIMGPINPMALEEFTALQERHAFLEEQLEDVKKTRRELSQVIHAVDQEIQNVFAAAFADVSENFTSLFAMLFPGGTGKLILTKPEDLLSTGIEVEAKPSGKNVKKLSLLSGGERSLTALAFLFAVFRSRPSPFYVMDEVEAALDDVNLHRFLGLVQEFRNEAQLIVVSHQKRTMEAADCLFGVTMQPGGSSKVISERVGAAVDS